MTELEQKERIHELEKALVKIEWETTNRLWTKQQAARYRELYEELQKLCPKYRGKRFWEAF